jgi:hypothetical protein
MGKIVEKWKPISGYAGHYWISDLGNVKSVAGLLTAINDGNYCRVRLHKKTRVLASIHRLVATAFCPKPKSKKVLEVNHKDGNKLNNAASNLEWVTKSRNGLHAYQLGLSKPTRCKPVLCIEDGKTYESQCAAARAYDTFEANISAQIKGRRKSVRGRTFKYLLQRPNGPGNLETE